MSENLYSQLQQSTIRLLRLLPKDRDSDDLRCELFEYPLQNSCKSSHPYEALSYVWGSEDESKSIAVNNRNLKIKPNLHNALLHLRDHACSRVMWIDAICINQEDEKEKEHQIPLMAEIYAKASRVVVWLGDADDGIGQALESIRLVAENPAKVLNAEQSITQLLQRPWFQRIWILQEMAAARHVIIICGSFEIDGHVFCLGLDYLGKEFQEAASQVIFLIRGAIFRPRSILKRQERLSLDVCSLGELADMYHTHKATIPHDKVYALLGMCSDDLIAAGLEPDYSLPWSMLMQRLTKFLLGDYVSVDTYIEKQRVIIKSKGCVLGTVTAIDINNGGGSRQMVEAEITTNSSTGHKINEVGRWLLRTPAKSVRRGDILCLLQGAMKPTIIRPWEDHFIIIVIEPIYPGGDAAWSKLAQSASFIRDFLLVWDWQTSFENQDPGPYTALMRANDLQSQHAQTESEIDMNDAIRRWHAAQILGDVNSLAKAGEKRQKAVDLFQVVVRREHTHSLECQCSQIPLLWAAESGESSVVDLLLTTDDSDPNLENIDGRTPLSLAAAVGHEAVVKLLLDTGKVDADSKDKQGQTPLSWAARRGHEAIVKLLLDTNKVGADSKDKQGQTPLSWAIESGHEAVVKLLLNTGKVDANSKDKQGQTPLLWAAEKGHDAVVKLLLNTGKVDADSKDNYGQTPLSWAAEKGHEAVVKLLLNTGKVDADSKDKQGQTPLSWATRRGNKAVVKLLLNTGKVDADSKDNYSQTPLSWAARRGHKAVVKLLLDTSKVDANSKDDHDQTPLSWAAEKGHEAVVKLLLDTGKVDASSKDNYGQTPLSWAARRGHEAVVKLLLDTSKVDANSKDDHDQTPLSWAARNGHEAVVKLLLDTSKVDANSKDNHGHTPLSWAVMSGHEAVVTLLRSSKVT